MAEQELSNQEKLDEMYHLMQENNEILRAIRRRENVALAFKMFYWIVILASLGGIYLFVSPLVNAFKSNVESGSTIQNLQKYLPSDNRFLNLFNRGTGTQSGNPSDTTATEPVQ